MHESLRRESENLVRSWAHHNASWLRGYLVAGVEDPRLNLQSVLSRHFLIRQLTGDRFSALMTEESRFAAVMNWLVDFVLHAGDAEQFAVLLHALRCNADNAEGTEIPHCVRHTFATLPVPCGEVTVPNYIERFLTQTTIANGSAEFHQPTLNTFQQLWLCALSSLRTPHSELRTLLEPACGSANDYRFLHSFGIAPFLDYTGFDLSEKNIANAHALVGTPPPASPNPHFLLANIFEIPAADKSFDLCFVHDLFEHLSLSGLEVAVREVCRVTRDALCIGFFQMDEIRDHIVRPVDDYYINLLSVDRTKALFATHSFQAQVIHIASFLRSKYACDFTHNPNAYTFLLTAV